MDLVSLAVLNNRFEGVARKLANSMLRTGWSGVLNIARDFSCCIATAEAGLLVANEGLPIHDLSGPAIMARVMKEFSPGLARGDAYLNNSPYHGCSHAADHTLLVPVLDDAGRHRFTVLAKAHQADIGNSIPTTYHGSAVDVYQEGALIFPSVQVQRDFQTNADFARMCQMRIRVPDQWWGDFLAMLGAVRIGEQEITAMAAELGWDKLTGFSAEWLDYSERRMVDAIRALPAGTACRSSTHDPLGTPASGIPVNVTVTIDPLAARIAVGLTDNIDCLPCGLYLSEACSRTPAMVGVFNSIEAAAPRNAGCYRRIDLALRENCMVGIPRPPTSTSVATTNVADRVTHPVQCAIVEIAAGQGLAGCGAVIPPSMAVIAVIHPKTGAAFVNQLFLGMTGGAAAPDADAWLTIGHVGNAGMCNLESVELDEMRQPIHVHSRRLLPDTEGAGQHIGAPSIEVEFGPVGCDISVAQFAKDHLRRKRHACGRDVHHITVELDSQCDEHDDKEQ